MLKFFNRLTKKKEEFKPYDGKKVKMYSCGPTVYSYQHIGNFRAYIFMDTLRRVIKYNGYDIDLAMNITDVGHMTSDEDVGEDKMLVASKREKKSPWEIAQFYTQIFFEDFKKLNIEMPTYVCKATEHVPDMVEYVKKLMEKGYAYETTTSIYFDIQKFKDYGKLSGIKTEDRLSGARIEVDEEKKHPADFALWIKAPKEHIMQWPSPWGMGYPGWHIECSVMGQKYLGEHIDIHTGGIDHVTVHHENEIAQNNSLNNHDVVRFWMELEFLQIDGSKMSKSLGNIYTISDLEKRGFNAIDFRYFLLTAHYLKMQNFTYEALEGARNTLKNLYKIALKHKNSKEFVTNEKLQSYKEKFLEAINDDLNTPQALGVVWDLLKEKPSKNIYELLLEFDKVLGIKIYEYEEKDLSVPFEIEQLAKERWQAKLAKNWTEADRLRKKIIDLGFNVLDEKEGYKITKQNEK